MTWEYVSRARVIEACPSLSCTSFGFTPDARSKEAVNNVANRVPEYQEVPQRRELS
jgi:hypothetical protein